MFLTQEQPKVNAQPDIIVVGGGKGGVGKSCLAVNLSLEIARRGWRTVVVDADLGCSNIETLFGMRPGAPLDDYFFDNEPKSLGSLLADTPYSNLRILPGASGLLEATDPGVDQLIRFRNAIHHIDADVVIVDLDAGTRRSTLDLFLLGSKSSIVVVTPEKTSMDNAFKFVRAALYRKIERFYDSPEVGRLLRYSETLPDFISDIERSKVLKHSLRGRIITEVCGLAASIHPKIVVNRARNPYEAMVTANIVSKYIRTHLLMEPDTLGHILFDKRIPDAVNLGIPFISKYPRHKVTRNVSTIGNRLGYL